MIKYYFLLIAVTIIISGCKKNDDNPSGELEAKLTTNLNVMHNAGIVYNDAFQQSGDSLAAVNAMRAWLAGHSEVSGGWVHNREFLEVEFTNGLKSSINIIPLRENGEHLRRGGGNDNGLASFRFSSVQSQEIKNKKALVLIPYPDEFGYSSYRIDNVRNALEAGDLNIEADIEVGSQVELNDLDRLGDYGLIILDVHGVKYGFFLAYLNKTFAPGEFSSAEEVIDEVFNLQSIPSEKIENGQIEIGLHIFIHSNGSIYLKFIVLITEDYIRQLGIDLSDAVLFGNHCYSGHTADGLSKYNMPEAWRSKGLACYYGYAGLDGTSAPVDNKFCRKRELNLINRLVTDGDTTGVAHLDANGEEYFELLPEGFRKNRAVLMTPITEPETGWPLYLRQFFEDDYEYESCGEELMDQRDQQVYQTVCIGDQVWMAENLNYDTLNNWCYDNNPANCNSLGRMYDWETALVACPDGWHLPSEAEFQELIDGLGGDAVAGGKLKATTGWDQPNTGATNSSGFSGMGNGEMDVSGFGNIGKAAYYWSTDPDGDHVRLLYLSNSTAEARTMKRVAQTYDPAYSCRCVKDD